MSTRDEIYSSSFNELSEHFGFGSAVCFLKDKLPDEFYQNLSGEEAVLAMQALPQFKWQDGVKKIFQRLLELDLNLDELKELIDVVKRSEPHNEDIDVLHTKLLRSLLVKISLKMKTLRDVGRSLRGIIPESDDDLAIFQTITEKAEASLNSQNDFYNFLRLIPLPSDRRLNVMIRSLDYVSRPEEITEIEEWAASLRNYFYRLKEEAQSEEFMADEERDIWGDKPDDFEVEVWYDKRKVPMGVLRELLLKFETKITETKDKFANPSS
jgi:DNA-binding transcriptional MerR regulator